MEKKEYELAELEIVHLETVDVITASGDGNDLGDM